MNSSVALSLSVVLGFSTYSAQADRPSVSRPRANTAAAAASPIVANEKPSALPPAPTKSPQPPPQPQPLPNRSDSGKCVSKFDSSHCSKPIWRCDSTIVVWPAYYTWPAYSYPLHYYGPDYSYVSSRATYRVDEPGRTTSSAQGYDIAYEDDSWKRGRDWGQDLRRDIVTFEDFIAYLAQEILAAPEAVRNQFANGFVEGYGQNADKALAKAIESAAKPRAQAQPPTSSGE